MASTCTLNLLSTLLNFLPLEFLSLAESAVGYKHLTTLKTTYGMPIVLSYI